MLVKPFSAIASLALNRLGVYEEGNLSFNGGYLYVSAVNNVSISISLYCLALFYIVTEEKLRPFRPLSKFLCIKAVLFCTFWQSCLFVLLTQLDVITSAQSTAFQNQLICVEMVAAAVAQSFAFSPEDFIDESGRSHKPLLKNFGKVLNVKDVIKDAHTTFLKKEPKHDFDMTELTGGDPFQYLDEEEEEQRRRVRSASGGAGAGEGAKVERRNKKDSSEEEEEDEVEHDEEELLGKQISKMRVS